VVVAYSDDAAVADQQIGAISGLLPLRDHLVYLIGNLPVEETGELSRADGRRASACLEKQVPTAQSLLAEAVAEALAAQGSQGRLSICSGPR